MAINPQANEDPYQEGRVDQKVGRVGGGSFGLVAIKPQANGDPYQKGIVNERVGKVGGGSSGPVAIKPQPMTDPRHRRKIVDKNGGEWGLFWTCRNKVTGHRRPPRKTQSR